MRYHIMLLLLTLMPINVCAHAQTPKREQQAPADPRVRDYWVDSTTGLMWAGRDNFGRDLNWHEANKHCIDSRLAGYSDWRLPTIAELERIYDKSATAVGLGGKRNDKGYTFHVKGDLFLTGDSWSVSELLDAQQRPTGWAWLFDFGNGRRYEDEQAFRTGKRALCVRRNKA